MADVKRTPLLYLQERDKETIAKHLDMLSAWKDVAASLGWTNLDISVIQNRSSQSGSATLRLLEAIQKTNTTLEDLMKHLLKLDILSVHSYLEENYPRIRKTYKDAQKQSASTFSSKKSLTHIPNHNPRFYSSGPNQTGIFKKCDRMSRLFLTYTTDDQDMVINATSCLHENGFPVSVYYKEKSIIGHDCLAWIQRRFQSATFVLVLITPDYLKTVSNGGLLSVEPDHPKMGARFAYKLMETEVESGCRLGGRPEEQWNGDESENRSTNSFKDEKWGGEYNRKASSTSSRFVGVILTKSYSSSSHTLKNDLRPVLPAWLKPLYCWPEDYQNLLFYLSIPQDAVQSLQSSGNKKLQEIAERKIKEISYSHNHTKSSVKAKHGGFNAGNGSVCSEKDSGPDMQRHYSDDGAEVIDGMGVGNTRTDQNVKAENPSNGVRKSSSAKTKAARKVFARLRTYISR